MRAPESLRCTVRVLVGLAVAVAGSNAAALQPLATFVAGARTRNFDRREARLLAEQREAEVGVARGVLLPSFTARGLYTHNQYEVKFALPGNEAGAPITITPKNQFDAFFTLTVPLVDAAAYGRFRAAGVAADAQQLSEEATGLAVESQIAAAYHRLIGAADLVEAARRTVEAAELNLRTVADRRSTGAASDLDVERAKAEIARAEQDEEEARLGHALAARSLETLSGVTPDGTPAVAPDDLSEEAPLEAWLRGIGGAPAVRAAAKADEAADLARSATKLTLLPSLSVNAEERLTNATSFVGRSSFYTLSANLTWSLDAGIKPRIEAQRAQAAIAAVRGDRVRRAVEDDVFEAWSRIRASIAKSRAARAQERAANRSAELARDRYGVGAATQVEVIQAQRDLFTANVARVRADAELALARTQLRIVAGRSLAPIRQRNP